ncbi:hypothetical protein PAAG_11223 [Paracoccidioides lutzii Pb01]|uniref:Uncharacterized protein n=1 Tax=Paracoccidioides lutzii (strain ATCC MYA-826 / Pb01) TaxID=502779 RepID=A0A0A2V7H1_PARBA|nr:hypothetical protein PAAG_11223 [Paracoccidioides lutzii Pb01]KGQ02045.1 hypothetical protein PAAG_11223 [Paracoccidioides lutzii Pb01]
MGHRRYRSKASACEKAPTLSTSQEGRIKGGGQPHPRCRYAIGSKDTRGGMRMRRGWFAVPLVKSSSVQRAEALVVLAELGEREE